MLCSATGRRSDQLLDADLRAGGDPRSAIAGANTRFGHRTAVAGRTVGRRCHHTCVVPWMHRPHPHWVDGWCVGWCSEPSTAGSWTMDFRMCPPRSAGSRWFPPSSDCRTANWCRSPVPPASGRWSRARDGSLPILRGWSRWTLVRTAAAPAGKSPTVEVQRAETGVLLQLLDTGTGR